MKENPSISIVVPKDSELNGMGQMMHQYLSQNIAEFPKKEKQALGLRCCVSVEVEGGIASTINFQKHTISIENGVADDADLYMKGSYRTLAKILSGQENPLGAIFKRHIKIMKFPKRPVQSIKTLQFLKIPPSLLNETQKTSGKKFIIWAAVVSIICGGMLYAYYW
jgi:putative sterol carrier protein